MSAIQSLIDETEVAMMAAQWGEPLRHQIQLEVQPEFWIPWEGKWHRRRGEVMFLLPRPGGLLLHRKAHYPTGAWRLLTGGIELNESARAAIAREPLEEVGLELPVTRYVAVIDYTITCRGESFPWVTHIFLLPFTDAPLRPSHDDEIAETAVAALPDLTGVAAHLEALPSPWADWGRFRAVAHRIVSQHVSPAELC